MERLIGAAEDSLDWHPSTLLPILLYSLFEGMREATILNPRHHQSRDS